MKTWTNISDKVLRSRLGYQTVNKLKDNLIYALEEQPWRPTGDTGIWMAYKDANTYTIKAGNYLINDQVYNLAADLDWTWSASGQNRGMDDGGAGNAASTPYYLYAVVYSSAFGVVASVTVPTSRFNTNLAGTSYDTNLYLGAIYNDSSQNLYNVSQMGAEFISNAMYEVGNTASTSFTSKTLCCPSSACIAALTLKASCSTSGISADALFSLDGTNTWHNTGIFVPGASALRTKLVSFKAPITSRTVYIKSNDAACTAYLYQQGWTDKYLR